MNDREKTTAGTLSYEVLSKKQTATMGTLVCEIGFGCGGLGDRIVGLVSAILLAKLSRRKLVIRWESPNMDAIWENQFRGGAPPRKSPNDIRWDFIDQRFKYRRELEKTPLDVLWLRHRNVYLRGNQEIASFAYSGHNGGDNDPEAFLRDITSTYADLFTKYLTVKNLVIPPRGVREEPPLTLGIQIRTGDTHMKAGHVEYISAEALKTNILPEIVKFIVGWQGPKKIDTIFMTSDFPQCAALLQDQLAAIPDAPIIISHIADKLVTHVDRPGASVAGLQKTILDLQQLAACRVQIFSWVSNFGRVAALMGLGFANQNNNNPPPELYTLYGNRIVPVGNNPVAVLALTTKHQQIRDQVTPPP